MKSITYLVLPLVFLMTGCTAGPNQTNIEPIDDMMDQENLKAQDYDQFRNEPSNRVPPEGTLAHGKMPNNLKNDPLAAGREWKNPLENSPDILAKGKQSYDIYCAVCHGSKGLGDGRVAQFMSPKPPTLLSDKVVNYADGQIFHVITYGQGGMGGYGSQIHDLDSRWAIVKYVREMQKTR